MKIFGYEIKKAEDKPYGVYPAQKRHIDMKKRKKLCVMGGCWNKVTIAGTLCENCKKKARNNYARRKRLR